MSVHSEQAAATEPTPPPAPAPPATTHRSPDQVLRYVYLVMPVTLALVVVLLFLGGWPRWWVYVAREWSPMTWMQSVLMVLTAFIAASVAAHAWLARRERREWLPFLLLTAGFGWLALDERFTIHERLRDNILAPRDIRIPFLPWMGAGDFLLPLYAVVGLVVLRLVLRALAGDRRARGLFIAGVAAAALVVAVDSFDPDRISLTVERYEQSAEEVVELTSATLFFLALLTFHLRARDPRTTTPKPEPDPG